MLPCGNPPPPLHLPGTPIAKSLQDKLWVPSRLLWSQYLRVCHDLNNQRKLPKRETEIFVWGGKRGSIRGVENRHWSAQDPLAHGSGRSYTISLLLPGRYPAILVALFLLSLFLISISPLPSRFLFDLCQARAFFGIRCINARVTIRKRSSI